MPIQPDAKVMQADLGGQASLEARQNMRSLSCQPKGIEQFLKNRLNQLTQVSQPSAPFFGPSSLATLMRRCHHLGVIQLAPTGMWFVARKTFVGQVDPLRLCSNTVQPLWRTHGLRNERGVEKGVK
jgi:hypothetical protein